MSRFPTTLETERLTIRASAPEAALELNAAVRASLSELQHWLAWADHVPPLDETLEFQRDAQARFAADLDHSFTLWERATATLVGAVGLHPRPADPHQREIGYWIRTSHTGRGYATEAVRAISQAGLVALALSAVQLKTSERNLASQRVAERAGFVRAAVLEDGRIDPGGFPSRTLLFVLKARAAVVVK